VVVTGRRDGVNSFEMLDKKLNEKLIVLKEFMVNAWNRRMAMGGYATRGETT
jgi:hypothetical protein